MKTLMNDTAYLDLPEQTEALLETVRDLSDDDLAQPSLCPGWTRGHVLSHLISNADGFLRALEEVQRGDVGTMYDSAESRQQGIDVGARRNLIDLEEDLESTSEALYIALAELMPEFHEARCFTVRGTEFSPQHIPWMRWKEVVLHHADLNVAMPWAQAGPLAIRAVTESLERFEKAGHDINLLLIDTSSGYEWKSGGAEITIAAPAHDLMAWLTGRGTPISLQPSDGAPLPTLPSWDV